MRFDKVRTAVEAMRQGKMVILVDDEDRENEGDLCMAADCVTAQAINFMATHGRGLICLTLTAERLSELQIPMMVVDNTSRFHTAFTVSIEARQGVTTGISAADRAHTIRTAVDPKSQPHDLARPGHIFPLRAQPGGVLVRTGQTEGSVDLARLAGHAPAGVICEVMNEDGTMARRDDLRLFAERHAMPIVSIADLIEYRSAHETLVHLLTSRTVDHPQYGRATLHVFGTVLDDRQHLAWVKGDVGGVCEQAAEPAALPQADNLAPLVRVQAGVQPHEVLAEFAQAGGGSHAATLAQLAHEPRAVWICLDGGPQTQTLADQVNHLEAGPVPVTGMELSSTEADGVLRQLGIGAQILRVLGLARIRLLAGQARKLAGLEGYGLHVDEIVLPTAANLSYSFPPSGGAGAE